MTEVFFRPSPYVGVYRRRDGKAWVAQIKVHGHRIHLGSFNTEAAAARAYADADRILRHPPDEVPSNAQ